MYCTHKNPHSENGRLFAFNRAESQSDFVGKLTCSKNGATALYRELGSESLAQFACRWPI